MQVSNQAKVEENWPVSTIQSSAYTHHFQEHQNCFEVLNLIDRHQREVVKDECEKRLSKIMK